MNTEATIAAALDDLRDALISGLPVDEAVAQTAEDHDLSEPLIRNRGARAYGDLSTYADRTRQNRADQARQVAALASRRENEARREAEGAAAFRSLLSDFCRENPNAAADLARLVGRGLR
jgi:hypothetical protein